MRRPQRSVIGTNHQFFTCPGRESGLRPTTATTKSRRQGLRKSDKRTSPSRRINNPACRPERDADAAPTGEHEEEDEWNHRLDGPADKRNVAEQVNDQQPYGRGKEPPGIPASIKQ